MCIHLPPGRPRPDESTPAARSRVRTCARPRRMFQYFIDQCGTPVTLIRLQLRHRLHMAFCWTSDQGVQRPADRSDMGHVNVIWQVTRTRPSCELRPAPPAVHPESDRARDASVRSLAQESARVGKQPCSPRPSPHRSAEHAADITRSWAAGRAARTDAGLVAHWVTSAANLKQADQVPEQGWDF